MCAGMYSPSLDHAAARGVRRAKRLRENTDSFMIACRCGVDWCLFRRGWAPTSPGECWCWRQWALKGVDLEIRSCDLYTALIYRSFFWSEAVPSRAPLHLFVSGWCRQASRPGQGPGAQLLFSTEDPEYQPPTCRLREWQRPAFFLSLSEVVLRGSYSADVNW